MRFQKVAIALAFSPRLEANLSEGIRAASYLNSELVLIHIGQRTNEKERVLSSLLEQHPYPKSKVSIIWKEGEPVSVINKVCVDEQVDLLIAGAAQNEGLLTYYTGSVARKLCRTAPCSLLLLLQPAVDSVKFNKVIVDAAPHQHCKDVVNSALFFANSIGASMVSLVEELDPKQIKYHSADDDTVSELAAKREKLVEEEKGRLESLLAECSYKDNLEINKQPIFGQSGYTIAHFAQSQRADLLVLHAPNRKTRFYHRLFIKGIEYILSDMPTNLLLIRPKKSA